MYACVCVYVCVCARARACLCAFVRACVGKYVCMYVCMYVSGMGIFRVLQEFRLLDSPQVLLEIHLDMGRKIVCV